MGEREALPHVTATVRDIVQVLVKDYLAANAKEQPTVEKETKPKDEQKQ